MAAISTRAKSPTRAEAIAKALKPGPEYGAGVLIGNWVEDRIECPKGGTLYFPPKDDIDFDKMKRESRHGDFRLNRLYSSQGLLELHRTVPSPSTVKLDRSREMIDLSHASRPNKIRQGYVVSVIRHSSHEKCGNYATTKDLVYNHLPKPLCGPILRYYKRSAHQYYPQPDLMKCFGNVTEWGLRKHLQQEWTCSAVEDYLSTLYEDTYVAPRPSQYLQGPDRKARNSSFTKTFRYKMTKPKQKRKQ